MENNILNLTDYQKELVRELERVSINTRYPGDFTMSINTFLLELVEIRKKREICCKCRECKKLNYCYNKND